MILALLVLLAAIAFAAGAFTALLCIWWSETADLRAMRNRRQFYDREMFR